jgi:hypothetical protein
MAQKSREDNAMKGGPAEAAKTTHDKFSALRSALRSAPPKEGGRSRSPLKAAVAQLLPELLAFRSKGYNGAELAEIMRDNGFVIAAATLNKYINEARTTRSGKKRKMKTSTAAPRSTTTAVEPDARAANAAKSIVVPPSLLATKPLAQNKRTAKEVLGHRFDDDL